MAAGGRLRFALPKASRGSGDLDVLCDGEKDRGQALAVFTPLALVGSLGVSTEDGKWKVDTGCRPLLFA